MRVYLEAQGSIFQGSSDSEIILHLIQRAKGTFLERIKHAFSLLEGAYACLILSEEGVFAIRDHNGLRPLSYAQFHDGYLISSESCAFDVLSGTLDKDVEPGEIVWFIQMALRMIVIEMHVKHICALWNISILHVPTV